MNILFYRYGSICEPDIISGFEELGNHIVELSIEITEKNLPAAERVQILSKNLSSRPFDFVFSVNFYPFISEVCNIYQLRYLCWTVDCPVMDLLSTSVANNWNRIFLFDLAQYKDISPRNPGHVFYLPLASNPLRWDSVIAESPSSCIERFSNDIAFVGSLYTEKCPYDQLENAPDYLTGYLDSIMAAQQKVYGSYFLEDVLTDDMVDQFREHMPEFYVPPQKAIRNDRVTMARNYLCPKISSIERVAAMKLLGSRHPVDLYTGSNTTGLPVHNHGLAKTLTEMPLIFHYSKINLNITSKAIRTGLPLRVFDVLGCGGFLLTNFQSELSLHFTPGVDIECYGNEDELLEKAEYYLTHEKDRIEIAHNGYETVKKHHNYPERLLELLSLAFNAP